MTNTTPQCCEKCYHDIQNGVVFAIFQCEDCPCHSPKAPTSLPTWESEVKEAVGLFALKILIALREVNEFGSATTDFDVKKAIALPQMDEVLNPIRTAIANARKEGMEEAMRLIEKELPDQYDTTPSHDDLVVNSVLRNILESLQARINKGDGT